VIIATVGSIALLSQAWQGSLEVYVPWSVAGLILFGIFWYRWNEAGTELEAIMDTLPGVPTEEYSPEIRGVEGAMEGSD
jgi:hypothetical protein